MFQRSDIILMDTNAIIEAHRTRCWKALAGYFRLETVESIGVEFPRLMGDFLKDLNQPDELDLSALTLILDEIRKNTESIANKASSTFAWKAGGDLGFVKGVIEKMPEKTQGILDDWLGKVKRVFKEWQDFRVITANRQMQQKAKARPCLTRPMAGPAKEWAMRS